MNSLLLAKLSRFLYLRIGNDQFEVNYNFHLKILLYCLDNFDVKEKMIEVKFSFLLKDSMTEIHKLLKM